MIRIGMRINFSGFIFTFFLWFSQFIGSPRLKRGTEKRKKAPRTASYPYPNPDLSFDGRRVVNTSRQPGKIKIQKPMRLTATDLNLNR